MTTSGKRISTEGSNLAQAIALAAKTLDVPTHCVMFDIDKDHFLSSSGSRTGVDTVKINAWARDANETKGGEAAVEWMQGLIENMGFTAKLSMEVTGDKAALIRVDSPEGSRLVGRRGSTLFAIQDLLVETMQKEFSEWCFKIDIVRKEQEDRQGRDRPRREDRRDNRDRRRGGSRRRSEDDVADLERLAAKLANQVLDTGEPIEIRQSLNSFERRVVHVTIADIEGVTTESFVDGEEKRIRIRSGSKTEG